MQKWLEGKDAGLQGSQCIAGFSAQLLDCFPGPASDGNSENNETFHTLIFNLGHKFPGELSKKLLRTITAEFWPPIG